MCYTDDARPPLPPIGGAAAEQGDMHLTSADGTSFMAYFARAAEPAGAVGFYGVPARVRDVMPQMEAPLLLLVAGTDFTPQEEFQKFDGELTEAGVPHRMVVYEDAPHSFFDRAFAAYTDECDDAWRQILDFVREPA